MCAYNKLYQKCEKAIVSFQIKDNRSEKNNTPLKLMLFTLQFLDIY